jgi:hypothetical protein
MSRLYLHCGLCGRRQAEGLLSRAAWGRLELEGGNVLQACPTCRSTAPDWESRLLTGAGEQGPDRLGS